MTLIQREELAARHAREANVILNRRCEAIAALDHVTAPTGLNLPASCHDHTYLMGTQVLCMNKWLTAFRDKRSRAAANQQQQAKDDDATTVV